MWSSRAHRRALSRILRDTSALPERPLSVEQPRRRHVGVAVACSLVGTVAAAHALERSGRLSADHEATAGLLAAVRFSRTLVVSASVMLDYRLLFAKFEDYSTDEYKQERSRAHQRCAERILNLCKTQGAVYVKIGQHVASMSHAVPKEYTTALKQLEDRAAYRPYHQIRRVLHSELGGEVEDHFSSFEKIPVAAASLAQVHRAHLIGTHEPVAVKVQYPGLEALVAGDLSSIRIMSRLLTAVFPYMSLDWMVREFRTNLSKEIDFVQEADSADRTASFFADEKRIAVPQNYRELSSKKVLTMEYIDGIRVDDVAALREAEIDPTEVAKEVVDAFARMVFVSGFVHCDGHSGNMLVKPCRQTKGDFQLFLLDHGLYRELNDEFRTAYCRLWRGLVLRRSQEVERACADLGAPGFSNVFSIFLLNRSWSSAQELGVDLRNKMTKEEVRALMKEFRDGGLENGADAAAFMKDLPQDLLLVFKMNSLVRNVNKALGAQIDRFRVNARHAVRGLHSRTSQSRRETIAKDFASHGRFAGLRAGKTVEGEFWIMGPGWDWLQRRILSPLAELVDLLVIEVNFAILDFALVVFKWWRGLPIARIDAADAIG